MMRALRGMEGRGKETIRYAMHTQMKISPDCSCISLGVIIIRKIINLRMAYEPVSVFPASRFDSPRFNNSDPMLLSTVGNQPAAFTSCRVVGLTPVLVLLSTLLRVTGNDHNRENKKQHKISPSSDHFNFLDKITVVTGCYDVLPK